ncbi:MAG: hypothetical protein HYT93_01000 [Parcubacteria group bacterium]|nr:hypothetical protein [Parcubacteria group bacterium]
MSERAQFITDLLKDINISIKEGRLSSLGPDFDAFAEEIVEALVEGRDDDIAHANDLVEKTYTFTVIQNDLVDIEPTAQIIAGQLRAFLKLLSIASRHRRKSSK